MYYRWLMVAAVFSLCTPAFLSAQDDLPAADPPVVADPDPGPADVPIFGGAATTVQLPEFGISIDADGVLKMARVADPRGRLHAARIAAARAALGRDIGAPSPLRKISLPRLEQAITARIAAGAGPDAAMQYLAGLLRVEQVFLYPESGEIVIAGPAEGWVEDGAGKVVGLTSGRPAVRLEDLAVALRLFPPGGRQRPVVGCSIDPPQAGLARLQQFQRTIPRVIPQNQRGIVAAQIAAGMEQALGMADVRVFGVADDTRFAAVMIEADYRMKRIGIGLENPPVPITSFLAALGSARVNALERWWFTPNYRCLRLSEDRLAAQLVGQGVRLQGEDKVIGPNGQLLNAAAKQNPASERFTVSFTQQYPKLAAVSPVYAELRNLVDLLVVAALLQREDYYGQAEWRPATLLDEEKLPVRTHRTPKQAACVANSQWKGSRLFSPAGGGVSIKPDLAFSAAYLLADADGKLKQAREQLNPRPEKADWWWD